MLVVCGWVDAGVGVGVGDTVVGVLLAFGIWRWRGVAWHELAK